VRGIDALDAYLGVDDFHAVDMDSSGAEKFVGPGVKDGVQKVTLKDAAGLAKEIDDLLCKKPTA
jgi:hypothetical protein